jgi:hypothetical protein
MLIFVILRVILVKIIPVFVEVFANYLTCLHVTILCLHVD